MILAVEEAPSTADFGLLPCSQSSTKFRLEDPANECANFCRVGGDQTRFQCSVERRHVPVDGFRKSHWVLVLSLGSNAAVLRTSPPFSEGSSVLMQASTYEDDLSLPSTLAELFRLVALCLTEVHLVTQQKSSSLPAPPQAVGARSPFQ